jgi:FkbM family methyltransferase
VKRWQLSDRADTACVADDWVPGVKVSRAAQIPRNIAHEWRMAWPRTQDRRSFLRYGTDAILSRAMSVVAMPERQRTIRLDGAVLTYRLQRGDIQSIREVWVEECYRPPVDTPLTTVVDLGMNIGLTSVWYGLHGASRLRCVEPVATNMALGRRNLAQNGVAAEFVEAAIGPEDGTTRFHVDPRHSNMGRVDRAGEIEVPVIGMPTLLADLERVDLLKIDIEGAELDLLRGDLGWLAKVNAIIIEFHLGYGDELVPVIEAQGFRFMPCGSVWWNSMDFFIRD